MRPEWRKCSQKRSHGPGGDLDCDVAAQAILKAGGKNYEKNDDADSLSAFPAAGAQCLFNF